MSFSLIQAVVQSNKNCTVLQKVSAAGVGPFDLTLMPISSDNARL